MAIFADDTIFIFNYDLVSDSWQQFELLSEPESDLSDTGFWWQLVCLF